MIDKKIKNFIKKQSINDFPKECCGFIIAEEKLFRCIPCTNIAQNPEQHFQISSKEYLNIKYKYKNILYIYHSHTNENCDFSETDKNCAENLSLPIILYNLKHNSIKIYEPINVKREYVGRYYQHGKYDCFKLIEEFYEKEKSIKFKYNQEFYKKTLEEMDIKSEIFRFYEINNFILVSKTEKLKLHDIILIDSFADNKPKHFALYLGEDKILHQPMFGFSKIENYCNFYKKRTNSIFRLKI